MPKHGPYTQGTPSWVDLQTSDPTAAKAFYSSLFGWKYDEQPMGEDAVYSIAMIDDDTVAGLAPQGADMVNVVATLPGTQTGAKERVYVISGHYDSRSLAIMDTDTLAPGANDDGSGTPAAAKVIFGLVWGDAMVVPEPTGK